MIFSYINKLLGNSSMRSRILYIIKFKLKIAIKVPVLPIPALINNKLISLNKFFL